MSGHQSSSSKSSCADIIRRQTQNDFCCFPSVSIAPLHYLLNLRIFLHYFLLFFFHVQGLSYCLSVYKDWVWNVYHHHHNRLMARFRDHPGEPVPEENFCTLWCKRRLTEADTLTIRLGTTPSGPTSAYLCHLPIFFTGRMPFLPPNQQHQSTEGN